MGPVVLREDRWLSPKLHALVQRIKPLLEQVADAKDGESWQFPFSRGLRDDLRYGDHYAGQWQLQRCALEQRWRGGPPELIELLEAATLAAGGSDGKDPDREAVPTE